MFIKKIVYFVFIIFALFIINDLFHSIFDLLQKNDLISRSKHELSVEEDKNKELKKKIKNVDMTSFVEEEARDKLFMVRPGEGIVVIAPTEYLKTKPSKQKNKETRPNWQQWWDTFFK